MLYHKMWYYCLCFLVLFSGFLQADYRYQVSVCAIFQNEAPYLKEWIEYHRLLGVEHFYLYNHQSCDHYQDVLQPYIAEEIVELKNEDADAKDIQTFNPLQSRCYTDCIKRAQGISKWIAFIDIDEFILPIKPQPLAEFLKAYERYGGIGVNWLMFGTSGVKKIPENKLLIESLVQCTETHYVDNRYVKSIVRPEYVSHFEHAHQPVFIKGYFGVNSDHFPFQGQLTDYVLHNKIRINHYWTRDEDFFNREKVARQKRWGGTPQPQLIFAKMNVKKDELILRYVNSLKSVK